jgi:hypothetical protein
MAINSRAIKGAPNAFEYSEIIDVSSGGSEQASEGLLATTNSTGMTFVVDRLDSPSDVKYKMQMTCALIEEVNKGTLVGDASVATPWHDWDVPGLDEDGFLDHDQFDWWVPVCTAVRMVTKSVNGGRLYWAVRGQ